MSISIENQSSTSTTGATTFNLSFTVASANKIVVVVGTGHSSDRTPTSVTYAGEALTKCAESDDGSFENSTIWYRDNPTSGTADVDVTWGAFISHIGIAATGLIGAAPGTPASVQQALTGTTANPSLTLSGTEAGDICIGGYASDLGSDGTTTADGHSFLDAEDLATDTDLSAQDVTASGASTVLSWTAIAVVSGNWAICGAAFRTDERLIRRPLKRYTRQPTTPGARVDDASELARHWMSVYVPGIDGAVKWDRKGANHASTLSGTFGYTYRGGRGAGVHMNGTATGTQSATAILATPITTYPVVQVAAGYFGAAATNYVLASPYASAGGGGQFSVIRLGTSSSIQYLVRANFGTIATLSITISGLSGGVLFCAVAQSLSATDHRFYVNGLMTTATTNTGAFTANDAINRLSLGNTSASGAVPLFGGVLFAAVGKVPLTDTDALALSADPTLFWQMFPYRPPGRVTVATAAGGTDFIPEWLYPPGPLSGLGSGLGA